ncbi:MAG: HDOD domain-containing protein, partial [Proteobacteria bacterium]|nr:HDOD domain-containing protein [Pseudomonadota bacterium]
EQCTEGGASFLERENKVVGADHQAFGGGLTAKWKFPRNLRAVVSMHHTPERLSMELQPFGSIVRAADILACDLKLGFHLTANADELSDELLDGIDLSRDQLPQLSMVVHAGGGSFKSQMRKADKSGAKLALILGESEMESGSVGIKFLREESPQIEIAQADLSGKLAEFLN